MIKHIFFKYQNIVLNVCWRLKDSQFEGTIGKRKHRTGREREERAWFDLFAMNYEFQFAA